MRGIALTLATGVVVAATVFAACGGSQGNTNGSNGGGHDGGASGSGSGGVSSGGTASSGTASSGTASSGTASSGTASSGTTSGGTSGGGNNGCPPYQMMCNGACVLQTGTANCGACGKSCAAGQACQGGVCTSSCPPGSGLTVCGGICTDTQTDNNNCGGCGTTCGPNMGCIGGSCGAATTFPTPAMCAGGGPPVVVTPGGTPMCLGGVAQTTFTWSVCSCKDITFQDNALVDGWNSQAGPYMPGQLGGGIGADNEITSMSGADIWGQAWADSKATSFSAQATVHYDLQSGGDVSADGLSVTHDAYVVGNISGDMTVGGTLYQTTGKASGGLNAKPLTTPVVAPCDCSHPVPVANTVAWAKTNNDNAAIGLDPAIMTQAGHPARLDLPCGVYYLQGFSSGGVIVGHGNVALFIDGDVSSSGLLTMTIADPTSQFDVWISGTITAQSQFSFGSGAYPALSRMYVGGTQTLDIQVGLIIGGELWAGNAPVTWESDSDMFGALFVGDFNVLSSFKLHQDQAVVTVGSNCPPPPGSSSGGGSGSGSGGTTSGSGSGSSTPPMCGTCKDCGNQACVNGTCGSCTTNADCCAPLICQAGSCIPLLH